MPKVSKHEGTSRPAMLSDNGHGGPTGRWHLPIRRPQDGGSIREALKMRAERPSPTRLGLSARNSLRLRVRQKRVDTAGPFAVFVYCSLLHGLLVGG